VPLVTKAEELEVGVYAGDLETTTAASIPCIWSILCQSSTMTESDEHFTSAAKEAAIQAKASEEVAAASAASAKADAEIARQFAGNSATFDARISRNEKQIANIMHGVAPDPFETDDSVAYVKDVPADALPYAEIEKVGGMTYRDEETNTLKSAKVTAITSTNHTLLIPEAVRAIDGYGLGVNANHYNRIEWRNGRVYHIQECVPIASKTLKAVDYGYTNITYYALPKSNTVDKGNTGTNIIASDFTTDTGAAINGSWDNISRIGAVLGAATYDWYWFGFAVGTTLAEAQAVIDDCEILVVLAEPIETDITDLLTADNFIEVEGGGTITMVNEYGYDVPSEIIYMVKEVTA
jgi:hypothetical protein